MPPPEEQPLVTPAGTTGSGVDLAQIRDRLHLSPEERFRQGVSASRRMMELRRRMRPAADRDGR